MKLRSNQICQGILIVLAIFLIYQIVCNCNKNKMSGGDNHAPVESVEENGVPKVETETEIETESDLNFDDPEYYNYEPVINDNVEEGGEESVVPDTSNVVEPVVEDEVKEEKKVDLEEYNITGLEGDTYHLLGSNEVVSDKNAKLNPSELLPADSKDMEGNNFLTATLSKSEQIIGVPTQTQRSRKNYDLRSAPPNPQVEVSPWNMSTMEPDKGRLTFEIGESHCAPCE